MKQKQKKSPQIFPEKPHVSSLTIAAIPLSANVFYGTFLSLSLFLTVLLYSGGVQVVRMDTDFKSVNTRELILQNKVGTLVAGYPIAQMTDVIAKQNKTTAAFLVGIGKKESNWGKRVPRDENGADCFNYWGYRGAGSRGIAMGHGCFGSPDRKSVV